MSVAAPSPSTEAVPGPGFSVDALYIDAASQVERIAHAIRQQVRRDLRRRGAVVALSGGIDSSVVAALCARALGPDKVLALLMPEAESEDDSLRLGRMMADALGVTALTENIAPLLEAAGCYARRDAAIRQMVPAFGPDWGCKIVLPGPLTGNGYNISRLVVEAPDGTQQQMRMTLEAYLAVVAAANMKQRTRKQLEYYHADRLNYAVAGTPNRLEFDQGFFVKNGDGAADIKPIAHLFKSQVYRLAEHLGVPEEIQGRPPTTDTWSLPQTQDEFYFPLPYREMDLCLCGLDRGAPAEAVARATGLTADQVCAVWRDIEAKRRATRYLHMAPLLVEPLDR